MLEISSAQYKEFAKQFDNDYSKKILSAFENRSPDDGTLINKVYADKVSKTQISLVIEESANDFNEKFIIINIAGNPKAHEYNNDLVDFIRFVKKNISSDCQEVFIPLPPLEWEQKLKRTLSGYIKIKNSLGYRLKKEVKENLKEHYDWRNMVPPGYTIVEYDCLSDEFLAKYGKDRNFFAPESKKFGVALIKDDIDTIISECYSVNIHEDNIAEIGVDTYQEQYRRKGFAYLTSMAFIESSLSRNFEPSWHTYNLNAASNALAKKLGLEEVTSKKVGFALV